MDKNLKQLYLKALSNHNWDWLIAPINGNYYKVFKSGAVRKATWEDVNKYPRGTPTG